MTAMGEVTVLMPHRNHGHFLMESVPRILAQTEPARELIIVDDASDDGSREALRDIAKREPRLTVLYNDTHLGIAASINRVLATVETEYLLLAAADDSILPHMIATLRPILASYPRAPFCASTYVEVDDDAPAHDPRRRREHGRESDLGPWFLDGDDAAYIDPAKFRRLLRRRFVWLSATTSLFRTEAMREIGGYQPELRWHADWFAVYTLAFRHGFCYSPTVCASFRLSRTSYSSGMLLPKEQAAVVAAIFDRLDRPDVADVRIAIRRTPGALAPFLGQSLLNSLNRPRDYALLGRAVAWWLRQYARRVRARLRREVSRWRGP